MTDRNHHHALVPQRVLDRLERLMLFTRHRAGGTMQGKRRSGQMGSSLEFADYRPYSPGDDLRKLDWHAYAKTGRPYVKLYLDEQELQVTLYVDVSASMNFPGGDRLPGQASGRTLPPGEPSLHGTGKLLYAKQLAACVGYAALCSYDRVSVQLFGEDITARLPMIRGRGSASRLFDFLAKAPVEAKGNIASVFMKPASLPLRPGLAWIFSDFLFPSGVEEAIRALLAARQEVRLVQVLSFDELHPALSGDLRLIDCETGEGKEVAISGNVLEAYADAVNHYTRGLERFCRERGVGYYLAVATDPLEETVLNSFRKAGLLQA